LHTYALSPWASVLFQMEHGCLKLHRSGKKVDSSYSLQNKP
jgi:hypothetical protein